MKVKKNYKNLEVALENDLLDDQNNSIAKVVVLKRDDSFDYAVLNCLTKNIDEFSFNQIDAISKFSNTVYYAGLSDFYKAEREEFVSINSDKRVSRPDFKRKFQTIKSKWEKRKDKENNNPTTPTSKDGYNGFYDWTKVANACNSSSGWVNNEWRYLPGITVSGVSSSINFYSQTTFNNAFSVSGSCGPTALTNMFIYFNSRGIKNKNGVENTLVNNSPYDTFSRFMTLAKFNNGTSHDNETAALKAYAKERSYNYELDRYIDTYEEFKENIDNQMPVLTTIRLKDWGGHAILVVGYESFAQEYQEEHSFLWFNWTTTEYRYARYLRVVDGWSTSNNSRYIDMTNYWDFLEGRGLRIYG